MDEWIRQVFQSPQFGLALLPAAFLLGLVTSAGSCCNYPLWAGVVGWGAGQKGWGPRQAAVPAVSFVVGSILFLAALGFGIGVIGEMWGETLRFYATLAGGLAAVFFGLGALNLLPFRLRGPAMVASTPPRGFWNSLLFGLVFGGAGMACGVCCGPGMPVALSMAALTKQGAWGGAVLATFGAGYSVPLAAAMIGANLTQSLGIVRKVAGPIRLIAGLVLVAAGFWMLISVV